MTKLEYISEFHAKVLKDWADVQANMDARDIPIGHYIKAKNYILSSMEEDHPQFRYLHKELQEMYIRKEIL